MIFYWNFNKYIFSFRVSNNCIAPLPHPFVLFSGVSAHWLICNRDVKIGPRAPPHHNVQPVQVANNQTTTQYSRRRRGRRGALDTSSQSRINLPIDDQHVLLNVRPRVRGFKIPTLGVDVHVHLINHKIKLAFAIRVIEVSAPIQDRLSVFRVMRSDLPTIFIRRTRFPETQISKIKI